MAILIKATDFAVPKPASLNLRGIQTDEYGVVMGGHGAIVDPLQSELTAAPVVGDVIENLVAGASNGSVFAAMVDDVASNNGFSFSSSDSANETIYLPSEFNLLTYGDTPCVVLSFWVTHRSISAAYNMIAGCTYQTGTYSQWYLSDNINADSVRFGINGANLFTNGVPALNVPHLYTVMLKKVDESTMECSAWVDTESMGITTAPYPLKNPDDSPASGAEIPRLGGGMGFGHGFDGVVHRCQSFEFDPAEFDVEAWIAQEIANNASRFVTA